MADRILLWVTLAYAREYMIQHYAYAPVSKRDPRELSRYTVYHKRNIYLYGLLTASVGVPDLQQPGVEASAEVTKLIFIIYTYKFPN